MRLRIIVIILSLIIAIFQSSFDFGIFNLNLSLIFFIYILFFHNPNDALISVFISSVVLDSFAINFGAYIISFILIFLILYYIEKELLPNDRFSTYLWMNLLGTILLFIFFALFNFIVKGIGFGFYYFNFKSYVLMLFEATIFNVLFSSFIYSLTFLFSKKTKNKVISIG